MILMDNACFKAKTFLGKINRPRNTKYYHRRTGLKAVEQGRLFASYVVMLKELATQSEHHRIVLFELIS